MPIRKERYQIYVDDGDGFTAYFGTNNFKQFVAVKAKLQRKGRKIKVRVNKKAPRTNGKTKPKKKPKRKKSFWENLIT